MKKRRRLAAIDSADNQAATVVPAQPQQASDSDCRHDVVYNGLCAICGQEVVSATAAGGPGSSLSQAAPSAPTAAAAALYDAFHPSQPHDLPHVDDLAASTPHHSASAAAPASPPSSSSTPSSSLSAVSSTAASAGSHRPLVVGTRLLHLTTSAFQSQLEANMHRLFNSRKLMLVLDIDHTLLHTTDDPTLSLIDPRLLPPSIHHFALPHPLSPLLPPHRHYLNLRPHLTHFLTSLVPLYDLHIYTMGSRPYAAHILPLLDPSGQLIKGRVVTRSESEGGVKVLERMCACDETMCVIVDDRVDVWSGDKRGSVLRALEYRYFAGREVYDREGKAGGAEDKRGAGRGATHRKAAEADERKEMAAARSRRHSEARRDRPEEAEEVEDDNREATAATATTSAEEERQEGQKEDEEQKEPSEADPVTAAQPLLAPAAEQLITIPEEILIDEEKESPPNSPTSTPAHKREVIAIDADDSSSSSSYADEAAVEEQEVAVEAKVAVQTKKPKKRVRFLDPVIESIRHIESDEADEDEDSESEADMAVLTPAEIEEGMNVAEMHWEKRLSPAVLDACVRCGEWDERAVQQYNEWCDIAEPSVELKLERNNFNIMVYDHLFRCPVPGCHRLLVHEAMPNGSECFSCVKQDNHIDSAVTGLPGPCYVYMDLEGRVTYVSATTPSAADQSQADESSKPMKKKRIPRKVAPRTSTDRPSFLSQLLAARAAASTAQASATAISPVLASQMDESKIDNVLLSLLAVLRALHLLFYAHYAPPPYPSLSAASPSSSLPASVDFSLPLPADCTLPFLLSRLKSSVLYDCHILFSGAFPSAQSAADTDIGKLARAFGATVHDGMEILGHGLRSRYFITHIVAARDGSDKIKAGLRLRDRRPHIVHLSWLYASAAHFQRAEERLFPLSLAAQADADEKAGVGGKENARGYVNPALVQHAQTVVTPLQLLRAMQRARPSFEVLTAMRAALHEETNGASTSQAAEEKAESSSGSSSSSSGGTTGSSSDSGGSSSGGGSANEGRIRRKRKALTTNSNIGQTSAEPQQRAAAEQVEHASGRDDTSGEAEAETAAADAMDERSGEAEIEQRSPDPDGERHMSNDARSFAAGE